MSGEGGMAVAQFQECEQVVVSVSAS